MVRLKRDWCLTFVRSVDHQRRHPTIELTSSREKLPLSRGDVGSNGYESIGPAQRIRSPHSRAKEP